MSNVGLAAATLTTVKYAPYVAGVSGPAGWSCTAIVVVHGHSGRGGGYTYTKVGYTCSATSVATPVLAPGGNVTLTFSAQYNAGSFS